MSNSGHEDENGILRGISSSLQLHKDESIMMRYVKDDLAEREREQVESHMAVCDQCLERFMAAIEAWEVADMGRNGLVGETNWPMVELPDTEQLNRQVSEQLLVEQEHLTIAASVANVNAIAIVQEKPYRRRSWIQHPATHYTIAAAITLLMLGTGTFNGLSERLTKIDQERVMESEPKQNLNQVEGPAKTSWSDRMIDRTTSWLHEVEGNRFK